MRNILKHYSGTQSGTPLSSKKSPNFDKNENLEKNKARKYYQNSFTRSALRFIITFYSQFQ